MKKIMLLIILLASYTLVMAQTNPRKLNTYQGETQAAADELCLGLNYTQGKNAQQIVDTILVTLDLQPNVMVAECPRVENCQAYLHHYQPYIFYNPNFLMPAEGLSFTTNKLPKVNWKVVGVLCHELAHLINNHLARLYNDPYVSIRSLELDADRYAGYMLYQLGAKLEQAQASLYLPEVSEEGTYSHPSRKERLAKVKEGWEKAQRKFGKRSVPSPPPAVYTRPPKPSNPRDLVPEGMVFVEGGTFMMGCDEERDRDCKEDEKPLHKVTVSDFYIGKYEVTVGEFKKFIDATGYKTDADKDGGSYVYPSFEKKFGVNWKYDEKGKVRSSGGSNYPVVHVSWNDAVAYCKWLSKTTGRTYRLPTETEWEYASRGGNVSQGYKYAGGNVLGQVGWDSENSGESIHLVGQKSSNELGLYDMSGNVWEWCSDRYAKNYYSNSPSRNPSGASSGSYRVLRGGGWINILDSNSCRVADRDYSGPDYRNHDNGFRLACSL